MTQQPTQTQRPFLPDEFVRPAYDGRSIANIPATVAALLDVPFAGLPALHEPLWRPLAGGVKRVITLLIDSLGWNLVEKGRPYLQPLLDEAAVVTQLTSIFPSTTVAALSSLWTGVAPAQHGLVGLSLFFPKYAVTGQLLDFSPVFGRYPDSLVEAGLEPETFLQAPGFAQQLAAADVRTYAWKGREIVHSVLSRMHGRGVAHSHGVITFADMLVQMQQVLEETAGEQLYLSAYWPTVDTISHRRSWDAPHTRAELRALTVQLQELFLARLTPAAREGTVLLLFADHGQVLTLPEQQIYLEDHPELERMLFMRPAGEPRVPYLYVKHGFQSAARDYINTRLAHAMVAWSREEVLAAGLLGPEPHAPQTAERVGDVVAMMRDGYVLLATRAAEQEWANKMLGRHGSLTTGEMTVPLLGFRLG